MINHTNLQEAATGEDIKQLIKEQNSWLEQALVVYAPVVVDYSKMAT